MEIDYRKYAPGVALAEKIVLVRCTVCDESAHARATKTQTKFVHVVRVERRFVESDDQRRHGRSYHAVVPTKFCRVKASERETFEVRAAERCKAAR